MIDFNAIRDQADQALSNDTQSAPESDQAERSSPESASQQEVPQQVSERAPSTTPQKETAAALFDISKAEKFLLDGKEITREQLLKERMLHADYTRKTQEFSKERQAQEAKLQEREDFFADLPKVLQNPDRLYELAQHYPKEYVELARQYIAQMQGNEEKSNQGQAASVDLSGIEKIIENRLKPFQEKFEQQEIAAIHSQIDSAIKTSSSKYPVVPENWALAELQARSSNGEKITAQVIEDVYKSLDGVLKEKMQAYHKETLKQQSEANKQARDIGSGGATPGLAPKKIKLSEARDAFMKSVMSRTT